MRMRKKKHEKERLAACAGMLLPAPASPVTSSLGDFGKEAPLALEIGCGKGGFIREVARRNPDVCFYALERVSNVMVTAVENAIATKEERKTDNLRFMIANAELLCDYFAPETLDVIYLNFSDPWPKKGHAKRRLTHRAFLERYFRILKEGGEIRFKTDNVGLFDFTLEEIEALGLTPAVVTRDLHASPYMEGNVMTEYERNFSSMGMPIHMLILKRP